MRRGGFIPTLPLSHDLPESVLRQVVNISSNFTIYSWENDAAMKNQSMKLFGKVAGALLNNSRGEVLDKFTQAAVEVRRYDVTSVGPL